MKKKTLREKTCKSFFDNYLVNNNARPCFGNTLIFSVPTPLFQLIVNDSQLSQYTNEVKIVNLFELTEVVDAVELLFLIVRKQ